jgi:hypothetical protein
VFSIPTIFLLSAGAAVLAALGFVLAHKFVKPIDLNEHQSFLDAMLSIVGTLVSILLGLLVAAALDRYQALEQNIDNEAASVAQIHRLANGLPLRDRNVIQSLSEEYCQKVIHNEWPAMAKGTASAEVFKVYVDLFRYVVQLKPQDNGETNIHNALLSSLSTMGDSRRQRILALNSAWSKHLMPVLLMCSGIVLAFAYLYVRKGALLHGVLICLVALALGGNLGLVFLLTNPYSGDWQIQPKGFELNLYSLKLLRSFPEAPKASDTDTKSAKP